MLDLEKLSEQYEDEYLKFGRVENPLNPRPDMCAFLMLDQIVPSKGTDMITGAEHDQIWLDVDTEAFAKAATEGQFRDLIRCGLMYDPEFESFALFV